MHRLLLILCLPLLLIACEAPRAEQCPSDAPRCCNGDEQATPHCEDGLWRCEAGFSERLPDDITHRCAPPALHEHAAVPTASGAATL